MVAYISSWLAWSGLDSPCSSTRRRSDIPNSKVETRRTSGEASSRAAGDDGQAAQPSGQSGSGRFQGRHLGSARTPRRDRRELLPAQGGLQIVDYSPELGSGGIELHVCGIGYPFYEELFPGRHAAYVVCSLELIAPGIQFQPARCSGRKTWVLSKSNLLALRTCLPTFSQWSAYEVFEPARPTRIFDKRVYECQPLELCRPSRARWPTSPPADTLYASHC